MTNRTYPTLAPNGVRPERLPIHESVTPERVAALVEREMSSLDNPGICLACGTEADGCEPDARNYRCENDACRKSAVFGAEEALLMLV